MKDMNPPGPWETEMTAENDPQSHPLIGRGNHDGAALFREWFGSLDECAEREEGAAYVFVMGSLNELLRSFDLPVVFPEINSLQTAVRRVAHEYLDEAEDLGYSADICGYVKADVAVQLRGGQHPMGRIPKPKLAVYTNACNTYIKWAEIWERMYGIPIFTLDVPGTRQRGGQTFPGERRFENDRRYVEAQIRELIGLCEEVTGRAFDVDRLRESMGFANEMSVSWKQVLEANRNRPSVFNALTEGTIYLGVANGFRGTAEGARYFRELVDGAQGGPGHPSPRRSMVCPATRSSAASTSSSASGAGPSSPRPTSGSRPGAPTAATSTTSPGRSRAWPRVCCCRSGTRWTRCSTTT